jgi:hypothetical protein
LLALKLQVRSRYCYIAGSQASGQKQILSLLLALKQHFKAEMGIATLLALKLQVRSRCCHNCWRSSSISRQKQVLPHCWHSGFRSEADIVTTAGALAMVQGRNSCCHIAGTQESGQKQILPQLLALKQQFKAETGIATLQALKLQVRSRYCHNCCHSSNSKRHKQVPYRIAT